MRLIVAATVLASMGFAFDARANWDTKVEDDIFSDGQKAMIIGMASLQSFIVADCDAQGDLSLGYAEKGEFNSGMELGKFRLLIKADSGKPVEAEATASERNDEIYQFQTHDRAVIMEILKVISGAKRTVLVGLEEPSFGIKFSTSVTARGSSKAVARFIKACALDTPPATD